jgi:hypothetical protein
MGIINKDGWRFRDFRAAMYNSEKKDWLKYYLPFSVKDKVILDVGAGEGESARFFIEQGARQVICVECDEFALANLQYNAKRHPEIVVVPEPFKLEHLTAFGCDLAKIDIEGYEEALLGTKPTGPTIVEIHGLQLRDRFQKEGWRIVYSRPKAEQNAGCCVYGYWQC